jgi:predicted TIM-barrel fold metal-dependent hydrolase
MQRIFDSHFHIIDPLFPLTPNEGYLPPPFTADAYLREVRDLGIAGGAIVSGSFQAFDQSYLLNALDRLGPFFVGVTQLPASVGDPVLRHLNNKGVRAVRFNVKRGGSAGIGELASLARRLYDLVGWHVELYIDSRELPQLEATLLQLPAVSIDHLGLSKEGLPIVVRLAAKGVRVKATGFGRVDFDVPTALEQIYAANPSALMFGTDLPSTRAPTPFKPTDIALVVDTLGPDAARRVLWGNAAEFYKVPRQEPELATRR